MVPMIFYKEPSKHRILKVAGFKNVSRDIFVYCEQAILNFWCKIGHMIVYRELRTGGKEKQRSIFLAGVSTPQKLGTNL